MASVIERIRRVPTLPATSPPTGTVPSALQASAARQSALLARGEGQKAQPWQMDALGYYDQLGVVRYASMFWPRALTKIRWYVAEKDESGELVESEDRAAQELLERVHDPQGGRTQMMTAYGQLRFLTGECYLIWTQPEDGEEESWEIVSVLELKQEGSTIIDGIRRPTYRRVKAPGVTAQELIEASDDDFEPMPGNVIVYRFWRRHPSYTLQADAPMRSVLAECEEIVRTTQAINARLVSRLAAAGIFAIPQSWTQTPVQAPIAAGNPQENPFQRILNLAMMKAIATPGSAEGVVPIVVVVPDEATDKAHHYKFWDPQERIEEVELRDRAIDRFALGVDMPKEKLQGMGESNHWNAWMIDEEAWEHVAPVAQEFADDMTGAYYLPAARDAGIANWENLVVAYDPSEFLANPNSFSDAKDMYDRRAVSKAYLRAAGNANDDDAMTDEELEESLLVATKQRIDVESGEVQEAEEPETSDQPDTGEDTERTSPPLPEEANGNTSAILVYRLLGLAEGEIESIRQRAGSRIRSYVQGNCKPCAEQIQGVPNAHVAHALGLDVLTELELDLRKLVSGTSTSFRTTARRWGISEAQAEYLGELLENHAGNTLTEDSGTLPPGFGARVTGLFGPS